MDPQDHRPRRRTPSTPPPPAPTLPGRGSDPSMQGSTAAGHSIYTLPHPSASGSYSTLGNTTRYDGDPQVYPGPPTSAHGGRDIGSLPPRQVLPEPSSSGHYSLQHNTTQYRGDPQVYQGPPTGAHARRDIGRDPLSQIYAEEQGTAQQPRESVEEEIEEDRVAQMFYKGKEKSSARKQTQRDVSSPPRELGRGQYRDSISLYAPPHRHRDRASSPSPHRGHHHRRAGSSPPPATYRRQAVSTAPSGRTQPLTLPELCGVMAIRDGGSDAFAPSEKDGNEGGEEAKPTSSKK